MAASRLEILDEKIDKLLEMAAHHEEHLKAINGSINQHQHKICENERRIRKLEINFKYYIGVVVGALAAISFILSNLL